MVLQLSDCNRESSNPLPRWKVLHHPSPLVQMISPDGSLLPEDQLVVRENLFALDHVFSTENNDKDGENNARDVYTTTAIQDMVLSVVEKGWNGIIFGLNGSTSEQVGSFGSAFSVNIDEEGENDGLIHMAADDIFASIDKQGQETRFVVRVSVLNICQDQVGDMLGSNPKTDKSGCLSASGEALHEERVDSPRALLKALVRGQEHHSASISSSKKQKSLIIYRITVDSCPVRVYKKAKQQEREVQKSCSGDGAKQKSHRSTEDLPFMVQSATLHLVDLSGLQSHVTMSGEEDDEIRRMNDDCEDEQDDSTMHKRFVNSATCKSSIVNSDH